MHLNTSAQSYRFKYFKTDDGLGQNYVYDIDQDSKGFLWIATGGGLSRFDGQKFQNYTKVEGLCEDFATKISIHPKGVLVGHNQGGLSILRAGKGETVLPDTIEDISTITGFAKSNDQYTWAISHNGYAIRIDSSLSIARARIKSEELLFNCVAMSPGGHLLIGTNSGLLLWHIETGAKMPGQPRKLEEIPPFEVKAITRLDDNNYLIGTSDQGIYHIHISNKGKISIASDLQKETVFAGLQSLMKDHENNIWVSTYNGAYKVSLQENMSVKQVVHYNEHNGLVNYVQCTFQDREENMWVGTFGNGLAIQQDEYFSFYSLNKEGWSDNTTAVLQERNLLWMGGEHGLVKLFQDTDSAIYYSSDNKFIDDQVTAIDIDILGRLWVGTSHSGLYVLDINNEVFKPFPIAKDRLSKSVNVIIFDGRFIWVGTKDGLYRIDQESLETKRYDTSSGLIHNNINDVFESHDGVIWVASHGNQMVNIKGDSIYYTEVVDFNQLIDIVSITEDGKHNIWVATYGHGIFEITKNRIIQFTKQDGLKSNYCYSIEAGGLNDIWIGHRGGLSRMSLLNYKVDVFDNKQGLQGDCNLNAMIKDKKGIIWTGTHLGLIRFDPFKFKKNVIPPAVNLSGIMLFENVLPSTEKLVLKYDAYKVTFNFLGISLKNPENVRYQYFLEGHDLDWSEPTSASHAIYPRLEDGTYKFWVKACNSDEVCSEETMLTQIEIAKPFWKQYWFFLITGLVLVAIVAFIIRIRERNQRQLQAYLENQLTLRTKEVVEQKEELESKNKDITDSITYALRIQNAILPGTEAIKKVFPESFIFYRPRDIVSGDFYWYQMIGNHFLVACADCTGHGVPGGFMSMISATVFKDIANQRKEINPADFLTAVDQSIRVSLKQNREQGTHDGLDVGLCSINLDSGLLTYAGAVRPLVIKTREGFQVIKGSSDSLGGMSLNDRKEFNNTAIQLQKGDVFYMFSDGYPDQFGEETGKKFKLKGVLDLLEEINHLPIPEQEAKVAEVFENWKGNEPQIDDVLLMGLRYE